MNKVCFDRLLPTKRKRISSAKQAIAENPNNKPTIEHHDPFSLALLTDCKWAIGRTIECSFVEGSVTQKRRVEEVVHRIEEFANLKFNFTENKKSEVRMGFDPNDGSWSYVGTDTLAIPFSQRTVNFGWLDDDTDQLEYDSVVFHEFLHTCGMIHEHSSPASGMKWNKEVVYADLAGSPNFWSKEDVDHNVFDKYSETVTQFSVFDPYSVMLYSFPARWTTDGFSAPWNTELSVTDKKYLGLFYPFSDIKIDGTPRLLTFPANVLKELDLVLTPSEAGKYEISVEPPTGTWISVLLPDKSKFYTKDKIELDLSAGKSMVRIRNTKVGGKYKVYVRHIE